MTLAPNVLGVIVPAVTTVLLLLGRQWFAERRSRRANAHDRLERRRVRRVELERASSTQENDRVELVLREWQKQLDWALKRAELSDVRAQQAEEGERECQRRCEELETRMERMEFDADFLDAHVIECTREIARLRREMGKLT